MTNIDPIVSPERVADCLTSGEDVVVCDVRWYLDGRSGREAYRTEHIAGAIFVSIDDDLAAHDRPPYEGRHPLPSAEQFAAALGRRGIANTATVIAYDDSGGGTAGRLVVMLRAIGQSAALLDGGLAAWPGERRSGDEERPATERSTVDWPPDRFVDADQLVALQANTGTVVIDARSAERYRGEPFALDPRLGHIPGARNVPWASLIDPDTKRFVDRDQLRSRLAAVGIDEDSDVVASCGSGVSACADLIALEAAGFRPGRLFVASWSGWASDPSRNAEVGDGN
jgi:thiosulfate/3-mercaptopyruvate sulfurtransferase